MSARERGLPSRDDEEQEEELQATLADAIDCGDEERIAELQACLSDPSRAGRRQFQRQYSRHVRHQEARRSHSSGDE